MYTLKQFIKEQFSGRIYLDMDGVLADFNNEVKNRFGTFSKNNADQLIKNIRKNNEVGIFRNLNILPEGMKLFNNLKKLDIWILSSVSNLKFIKGEKKEWIREHFPEIPLNQVILVNSSRDKKKYGKSGDVLIDDFKRNIDDFNLAGGIGVFHDGSSKNTLKKLKNLKII